MNFYILFTAITIIMNAFTFILFGVDKLKAKHGRWRIPEATLLFSCLLLGGIGGLIGMFFFHHKTRKWKFRILVPILAVIDAVLIAFLFWTSDYYHAGETAQAAMHTDDIVSVEKTNGGWLFDGPSDDEMLIFYPGAKVEETAYAPLLHRLAEKDMDVYLVKMPLHLAFFGINAADKAAKTWSYDRYYIGGHSLGGAMAASYAAGHENAIAGEILLAAYPTKKTPVNTLLVFGSEDGVLNMSNVEKSQDLVTGVYKKCEISGGNHAQFGDYGEQAGDGTAAIAMQEQLDQTLQAIESFLDT